MPGSTAYLRTPRSRGAERARNDATIHAPLAGAVASPSKASLRPVGEFLRQHRRWGVVGLLFLFSVLNNLDRQTLAVLAATLQAQLRFGPIEYSYIVAAFLTAYSIGYFFCGRLIDRFGVKWCLAAALVFWSTAGMLHAAAAGWVTLAVFRALLGFGESFNVPAGVKAISEWIPPRERGLSIAVFTNGYVLGAMIAPPAVAVLTLYVGWRISFLFSGAVGFVLASIWLRFYYAPSDHPTLTPEERKIVTDFKVGQIEQAAATSSPWQVLRQPLGIGFFLAQFLTDPISFFLNFWLPSYLQSRGLTLGMIGLVAWIPFLGADVGGPGGGLLSDWLVRRNWKPVEARSVLMLVSAVMMLLANFVMYADAIWLSIPLIAALFAAQSCWKANQLALIAESVPRVRVGSFVALSALGGSVGGVLTSLLSGRVIAAYGYMPVFVTISCLPLVAFSVLLISLRTIRPKM